MPVGELDDVEHGLLVEVGLREDHFVGAVSLEHRREAVERWRRGRPGERADDVDPEPALRRVELPLEVPKAVLLSDEQQPPANAGDAHQLE